MDHKIWTENQYAIVFVSPERLASFAGPETRERISLLVIDEAHCMIQDGKTYRPAYLALGDFRRHYLPRTPTLALTATVTHEAYREIIRLLYMRHPTITIRSNLFRPNLRYTVRVRAQNLLHQLRAALDETSGRCIIYARTRKECEQLASALVTEAKVDAVAYHAGLDMAVRRQIQTSTPRCVVATISFGMGVNIPDIRLVVHIGIAKSIAAYVQETGRAGRDGAPSRCTLLYRDSDARRLVHMVTEDHERRDLRQMEAWARQTTRCRAMALLAHFRFSEQDRTHDIGADHRCACDVCAAGAAAPAGPGAAAPVVEAHQRLMCRAVYQTGNYHGKAFPISYLRGSKNQKVLRYADVVEQTVHGAGRELSAGAWQTVHEALVARRFLVQKHTRTGNVIFQLSTTVPAAWYLPAV